VVVTSTTSRSARPEEIESLVLNGDTAERLVELEIENAELTALLETLTRPKPPRPGEER
jgi:hypothetical protein